MGLLGNGWDDPQSSAMMALAGGLMQGNPGAGLMGANNAYAQARQDAFKQKFMDMQMQNYASEIEQRKAALERQQKLMTLLPRVLGARAPAQQGQLGSGTFGIMPTAQGVPDIPQGGSGIGNASIGDLATVEALGGPKLLDYYKAANEGFERKPGSFYDIPGKGREYVSDPTKGITFQNGKVGLLPGFTDTQTALTLASEAPKTLLSSAATVNLRKNGDGTESPVSSLAENPTLQNVLGGIFGRPPMAAPSAPRPMTAPAQAPSVAPQPGMVGKFQGDPAAVSAAIENIADPQERANARSAFESQMRANGGALPIVYGKTTAQEIKDAANKEYAVKTAGDVVEQRKSIMNADLAAPGNIAKYQRIGQLLSDVDGGKFTPAGYEMASALNSVGIKVNKNLPNVQAAQAMANEVALTLRNPQGGAGMPGALSDRDREFLTSMTPSITQSAEGRKMVIDAYVALQQRNQQIAKFARNYEKKYGQLDNSFFDQLSMWSNQNPLFRGK